AQEAALAWRARANLSSVLAEIARPTGNANLSALLREMAAGGKGGATLVEPANDALLGSSSGGRQLIATRKLWCRRGDVDAAYEAMRSAGLRVVKNSTEAVNRGSSFYEPRYRVIHLHPNASKAEILEELGHAYQHLARLRNGHPLPGVARLLP